MRVTVENTGNLGRRVKVQIPLQEVKTEVQNKINEFSQTAKVSGFRPGKVDQKIMTQKFGKKARQEALGNVIEKTLPVALMQEKLKPAGSPVVESVSDEDGSKDNQDFEYVVKFEIYPEIALADFGQIKVEKYRTDINEKDVDYALQKVRNHFADWVVVERPAKEGDRVIVDYNSTINGKPYENNQGQDIHIEIGSHRFITGFEEGLIGAKQGDELSMDLSFPPEWRMEKLAGKPVNFKVKIKAVTEKQLADVNAVFAKKIGAASDDEAAIRNKIRDSLEKQIAEIINANLREQVTSALIRNNTFPIPQVLIEREAQLMHEELHQRMGDKAHKTCHHHGLEEQAEKRVALGLILNEVIKEQGIKPDDAKVRARIAKLAQMFGNSDLIENMYQESEELLAGVRHAVMLDQALDWVLSKVSVTEKPVKVETLLQQEIAGA